MTDRHVLVVDDSVVTRRMVERLLGGRGLRAALAASGEEGLSALQAGPAPDLLVCDLQLPGISGIQVLETLRGDPRWGSVPVLVLTGQARGEDMVRAEALADRVMTKPFSSVDFLEAIEGLLDAGEGRAAS